MNQWYAYKSMGGRGGWIQRQRQRNKNTRAKEKHTGPLDGQITISEKKNYRKVTMKLEKIAGMKKLHAK